MSQARGTASLAAPVTRDAGVGRSGRNGCAVTPLRSPLAGAGAGALLGGFSCCSGVQRESSVGAARAPAEANERTPPANRNTSERRAPVRRLCWAREQGSE